MRVTCARVRRPEREFLRRSRSRQIGGVQIFTQLLLEIPMVLQCFQQFAAGLETRGWFFRERAGNYVAQTCVDGRIEFARRNRLFVDDLINYGGDVLSRKWFFAGDEFVKNYAERENIGAA